MVLLHECGQNGSLDQEADWYHIRTDLGVVLKRKLSWMNKVSIYHSDYLSLLDVGSVKRSPLQALTSEGTQSRAIAAAHSGI